MTITQQEQTFIQEIADLFIRKGITADEYGAMNQEQKNQLMFQAMEYRMEGIKKAGDALISLSESDPEALAEFMNTGNAEALKGKI